MFVDKVKINISSGAGGDGRTSFMTASNKPNGGPNGGDGGKGGDVIFVADESKSTLIDFYYQTFYKGIDGEKGGTNNCFGKGGADCIISVPLGTVISDAGTGEILADMYDHGIRFKALSGGRGGFGNTHYATSKRQAPSFSQLGEKAASMQVILELKLIADVGLIGFPNVGKSTLLSVISDAKPKIANYHFTTLSPNLGVVRYYGNSFVCADIPGLIEGASSGAGLGLEFLRHIERTRLLVHVIDISGSEGRDPVEDYKTINLELKKFSRTVSTLPQIIALNKSDSIVDDAEVRRFKKAVKGKKILSVSAATKSGVADLVKAVYEKLSTLPKPEPFIAERAEVKKQVVKGYTVTQVRSGFFDVSGQLVENLARNVVLSDTESFAYFQNSLIKYGVIDTLLQKGMGEGDTVKILDIEFEYIQ